jgi:hypothetical protein
LSLDTVKNKLEYCSDGIGIGIVVIDEIKIKQVERQTKAYGATYDTPAQDHDHLSIDLFGMERARDKHGDKDDARAAKRKEGKFIKMSSIHFYNIFFFSSFSFFIVVCLCQ